MTRSRTPHAVALGELRADGLADELAEHGYVYDDEVPEGFDHAGFLESRLGPLLPQYDGRTVWSIKAERRYDDVYHSLNTRHLMPHTECYEWDGVPPRYLALWCVVPNADPGGQTTLADARSVLDALDPDTRRTLRTRRYRFVSSAGLQRMDLGRDAWHPIVEERPGRSPVLRFSCQCIHEPDAFARDIGRRLQDHFDASAVEIDFTPRSLLVWDNHRMLHSRRAFTDERRHLRRVWIAET